jgi:HK97 family phage major capsid protein
VAGGLTFTRRPETVAIDATRQQREMLTFKAATLMGISYCTNELLADSPGTWAARLNNGYRMQRDAHMFNEKLRGKGGNEYLGILTALSSATLGPTITVAKESQQAATTIVAKNVIKMRARCWGYGQAIWIANHDCYPELAVMAVPVGVGGSTLIYQQSLQEDRPDMLLGRPIFYSEYCSTLGAVGDIVLANFGQYAEGIYQPLMSAESVHVRFIQNENTMRLTERNCGAPTWRVPLTPNQSSSTLSPFVILAVRS